ncbi:hypothetical protein ACM66B_005987 [Microbotryomycetes sp. NB124-2]
MTSAAKFSGLPDIDTAPDVYETPDAPPEQSKQFDSDSDDEFDRVAAQSRRTAGTADGDADGYDRSRLDPTRARTRFKQASTSTRDPAAHRMTRRLPSSSEYVLQPRSAQAGTEPGSETPLERLRRLRTEIAELEEDVQREKQQKEEADALEAVDAKEKPAKARKKGEVTPAVLLQQLQLLKGDIQAIEQVQESSKLASTPATPAVPAKPRSASMSSSVRGGSLKSPSVSDNKVLPTVPSRSNDLAGRGAASLEERLAQIERLLGTQEADVDEVSAMPAPVYKTVSRLDHLVTLLAQPRHLDSISRRVKVLVTDLERLHEARRKLGDTRPLNVALSGGMTVAVGGADKSVPVSSLGASIGPASRPTTGSDTLTPDALQKIDTLFALVPRLEPLVPLAPRLLARLRSLSTLHASAADFSSELASAKTELEKLTDERDGLKEVIAELSQSLSENESRLKTNLEAMDTRFEKLSQRMKELGV